MSIALMAGVLLLELLFVLSYVGGLHSPKPHHLPIGVVGTSQAVAGFTQALESSSSASSFSIRSFPDENAARSAIANTDIFGAYIFGAERDQFLYASAANPTVARSLIDAISPIATKSGRTVTLADVRPLPVSDSRGLASFYLVVGWVVGGYLVATILGLARGMAGATRKLAMLRIGGLAGFAVLSGILSALMIESFMGVLHGNGVGLALIGMLVVFATATFTAALESLLGLVGTGLAILLFVVVGNPSSGGPFPGDLLPTFWRVVGPYLPPGAGTTLVHNTIYFAAHDIAHSIVVLLAYCLIGIAGMLTFANRNNPFDPLVD